MTPGEKLLLDDAEEEIRQAQDAQGGGTKGIPRHPVIESTETVLEAGVFGFEFSGQPTAEAAPGAGAPPEEGGCSPPELCCIINDDDPEFPYNERWGFDPDFTDEWNTAWCPSVTLVDSGSGYYHYFVLGDEGSVGTIHCSNAAPDNCTDMSCDFVITCRVRLYPAAGGDYRLAVAGESSGFWNHLYFWANITAAQFTAAQSSAVTISNGITSCSDNPADSYDLDIYTPQIVDGTLPVAATIGSMTFSVDI